MDIEQDQILAIAATLFIMIVVVPLGVRTWKNWQMNTYSDAQVWLDKFKEARQKKQEADTNAAETNVSLTKNTEVSNKTVMSEEDELIIELISAHLAQAAHITKWIVVWPLIALILVIGTAFYINMRSTFNEVIPPSISTANDTVIIASGVITIICLLIYIYKKKELASYYVLLDSFAEAQGIEGELTQEKLNNIKKIVY